MFVVSPAQAAEIRAGVYGHDVVSFDGGVSGKEESVGVTLSYVSSPFSDRWYVPRLEIGGDLNLGGATSLAFAGGLWRFHFGAQDRVYFEFGGGLAVHDGVKEAPDLEPGITAEEAAYRHWNNDNHIELGSDVLFREALALGYRFTDQWSGDVYIEHFSHGKILSSGSNEGLDIVGVRLSYALD